MPTALLSLEVLLGVLALVVVAFLVVTFVRRRTIGRGRALPLCGLRRQEGQRWRMGLARLGSSGYEWFTLLGVWPRPRYAWDRVDLELGERQVLERADRIDLIPDAVAVWCTVAGERFQLAMPPTAYTALRSWAEAGPPGSAVDVA